MKPCTICAIFLVLLSTSCRSINPSGSVNISIPPTVQKYTVQNLIPEMDVYSATPETFTEERAITRARTFGVTGPVVDSGEFAIVKDSHRIVKIHKKTGIIFYQDTDKQWGADFREGQGAIGENAAISAAESYLNQQKLSGLDKATHFQVNETRRAYSVDNHVDLIEREIVFKRKIGGHVIIGPGGQISVFVGPTGKIHGAMVDWLPLKRERSVHVNQLSRLEGNIRDAVVERNHRAPASAQVSGFGVTTTHLNYMGFIKPDGSRVFMPAFSVEGTKAYADHSESDVVVVSGSDEAPFPADIPVTGTTNGTTANAGNGVLPTSPKDSDLRPIIKDILHPVTFPNKAK